MILILSNADTDILAIRSIVEGLPSGFPQISAWNPSNLEDLPSLDGVDVVIIRLLGGRRSFEAQFDELRERCARGTIPLLAFGGEAFCDAELTELSSVPSTTIVQGFEYLLYGGLYNLENFLRFVSDAVLFTGFGFAPAREVPSCGLYDDQDIDPSKPSIAVVFYRAQLLSGNTSFIDDLMNAVRERGANAIGVYCYSLRPDENGRVEALEMLADIGVDCIITTVLAMGSSNGDEWDASQLAALDIPVIQAVPATTSSQVWENSDAGLSPLDVAMAVAIPEFDGRIISVPFSFKEVVDDGDEFMAPVSAYRTIYDRTARVSGTAVRQASLSRIEPAKRRIAIVLSAYPTKLSRIGNAVALDTPASVIGLLHALRDQGYYVDRIPQTPDELMAEIVATFDYESSTLSDEQREHVAGSISIEDYRECFEAFPAPLKKTVVDAWGEPPGSIFVDRGELVFPGLDLGGVIIAVQPPRGFGENPIAIYHSPDLAPTHHYLAFYRWLDEHWGAHAVIHAGKHGTLEWLPGKGVGLSSSCGPDAALGDMPFIYPFVVNDPGEGTQAKRRAHAVVVDHLLPPMTRAETYDDLARLESLLDEYAQVNSLDPAKLPAIRAKVWDLLVSAEIHRDLGIDDRPTEDDFDDLILHVDGYLCELKDAQIRGGLHVLGQVPTGTKEIDLVLAMTRLPQGSVPSLRANLSTGASRSEVDDLEAKNRQLLEDLSERGWEYEGNNPTLRWICDSLIPRLADTPSEISNILKALDGRRVPPGPSGAPTRGMAHVLPTGRNFYSVDPKAIPSQLAWDVGQHLADEIVERYQAEEGCFPQCVGLVVWGTAAMRTMGDDIASALALLGVRPVWQEESRRVIGLELIPIEELGRPRVDVTLRISGFFRDAFPHVIELLDDAFSLAGFDDDPRIFGSKPGAYGSGILSVLDSGNWRSDEDLASVYEAWSGWSYGRNQMGAPALEAMRRRFGAIQVALKYQDNREHDIFDSDDYLQDHGGMIATIRSLTGVEPKAWFGDSADPLHPKVRTLAQEAARVVRTRVINPKWITAMQEHGYKGAFEMAATVDYLFGYDATAHVVEDWMYERVTQAYVSDPQIRKFFEQSNPWALRSIAERLMEASDRGLWNASDEALASLRSAILEAEGWEEAR